MNRKLKLSELNRLDVAAFKKVEKISCILVLDNIRSHHNVGALFRTADAFKIEKILLIGITPKPPHREINKSALGATESVSWEYVDSCSAAIEMLQTEGYTIIALEQTQNSKAFEVIQSSDKIALVVGNEVDGVSDEFIHAAKHCVEIPQEGTKHSLNVSVAGGIALWEVYKILS